MNDKQRGNRRLMRSMNVKLVVDHLRAADTISQAELVRLTRLSVGTIVRIVRTLKQQGLVEEVGLGRSRVGRRPVQLRFNRTSQYVVAADFAPDETTLAVLDLCGQVLHDTRFPFRSVPKPQQFAARLKERVWQLLRDHRIARRRIAGIGVATHGSADIETGIVRYSRHLGWRDVPLGQILFDTFKLPVRVDSHARTMTTAEQRWGAGVGAEHLLVIEVDVGIGATIISDGHMVRGCHGIAGELGQNLLRRANGAGAPLCLEDVASGRAMVDAMMRQGGAPWRAQLENQSLRLALRALFDAASDGDRTAMSVIHDAADHMGRALAHMLNLYDPDRIILAGSTIAESRGLYIARVRDIAMRQAFNAADRAVTIEPAALGERASLLGAAAMIYDDVFSVDGALLDGG